MKSEKEILEALHILRDVCIENEGKCCKCILRNSNNDCGVIADSFGDSHRTIADWELKNEHNPRLILN